MASKEPTSKEFLGINFLGLPSNNKSKEKYNSVITHIRTVKISSNPATKPLLKALPPDSETPLF